MINLSPRDLSARLAAGGAAPLLVDVREPWEYRICRLEGSRLIPMRDIPRAVAEEEIERSRQIAVVCHHGIRSRQVALYLEHMGYKDVINLAGGVEAWARDVDSSMPTY